MQAESSVPRRKVRVLREVTPNTQEPTRLEGGALSVKAWHLRPGLLTLTVRGAGQAVRWNSTSTHALVQCNTTIIVQGAAAGGSRRRPRPGCAP